MKLMKILWKCFLLNIIFLSNSERYPNWPYAWHVETINSLLLRSLQQTFQPSVPMPSSNLLKSKSTNYFNKFEFLVTHFSSWRNTKASWVVSNPLCVKSLAWSQFQDCSHVRLLEFPKSIYTEANTCFPPFTKKLT